jgi:hypothetical protein
MNPPDPAETPANTVMEKCPECGHSVASIHMRDMAGAKRVCCVCEARLAGEAKKLGTAANGTSHAGMLKKVLLVLFVLLFGAAAYLYWGDPDFLKHHRNWPLVELLESAVSGKPAGDGPGHGPSGKN